MNSSTPPSTNNDDNSNTYSQDQNQTGNIDPDEVYIGHGLTDADDVLYSVYTREDRTKQLGKQAEGWLSLCVVAEVTILKEVEDYKRVVDEHVNRLLELARNREEENEAEGQEERDEREGQEGPEEDRPRAKL
jgi:hypothetical protein